MIRIPQLRPRRRNWALPIIIVLLVAGHAVILRYVSSRLMRSAAVVLGAVILLVITHAGLLAPLWARFRTHRELSNDDHP